MPAFLLQQQSHLYQEFRCTGGACEDTCCHGLQIGIDRQTYEKYQHCSHSVLRPQLQQWIQIQPAPAKESYYAKITLAGATCPFLSEGLCSIQKELGADSLSKMCATFPRITNRVVGVIEKSLDLSCPEAARLLLTSPGPAVFQQVDGSVSDDDTLAPESGNSHPFFWEIRSAFLSLLQDRRYPLTKRLLLAGHICEKLDELEASGRIEEIPQLLEGFTLGIDAGLYDGHLQSCFADAAAQITIVLELLAERISLDYAPPGFLQLYETLTDALQLQPGVNSAEAGRRYAQAYTRWYVPFLSAHEYMLEHYLVYYAYKTIFPFDPSLLNVSLPDGERHNRYTTCYMLMASFFAITQTVLVGLAAHHGSDFGVPHVVRCIQSLSRNLEHCITYPSVILQVLAAENIRSAAAVSVLTQPPRYPLYRIRGINPEGTLTPVP